MTFKSEVLEILEANKTKKVSSIIELIEQLNDGKKPRQQTYLMNSDNTPFAVFCYYHKQWELITETKYGIKSGSKTGLNTMCKTGTNTWTKQQKVSKKAQTDLLDQLLRGEIDTDQAEQIKADIELARTSIDYGDTIGYDLEAVTGLLNG